jgi:hypothetical protein
MGWSGGSALMADVIDASRKAVPDEKTRARFCKKVIAAFQDHDCDTLYECEGVDPVFDKALKASES